MTARRWWPLGVALLVVLLHLPYLWPGGPWARNPVPLILGQDEGTVLYDSHRIEIGQVMYRDFFEFQGPVFYYLHAGLFALIGGPSVLAARLLGLLISAAGATLLAVLVARFAGRIAGVAAALIHACLLVAMWPFDYPHWLAEALAIGGLVLCARDGSRPRDQIAAGSCFALSALTIQSVGIPVLAAALGVSFFPGIAARDVRLALLRPLQLLAGVAIPAVLVAVYFAAHGALGDLVYAMFVWPFTNYPLGQGAASTYAWGTREAMLAHERAQDGLALALATFSVRLAYLLPMFALLAAPAAVVSVARNAWLRRVDGFGPIYAAGAALAAVSPLWLAPVRPDLVHVAFVGSFGLIGLACLLGPLRRAWARSVVAAVFALAGALVAANYVAKVIRTWDASRGLGNWREEVLKLSQARRIDLLASPDDSIVVGRMGGFYYLHVRPSAVPNTYIPARASRYLTETQWQRIADDIAARRPVALMLVGKQWEEILKRRPELEQLYRESGALYLRANVRATDSPIPNSSQSDTASGGE